MDIHIMYFVKLHDLNEFHYLDIHEISHFSECNIYNPLLKSNLLALLMNYPYLFQN